MDKKTDYFSDPIAEKYDENLADFFLDAAIHPVLNILKELTGNGRALELGVGTGRLAIPLVARSLCVRLLQTHLLHRSPPCPLEQRSIQPV